MRDDFECDERKFGYWRKTVKKNDQIKKEKKQIQITKYEDDVRNFGCWHKTLKKTNKQIK